MNRPLNRALLLGLAALAVIAVFTVLLFRPGKPAEPVEQAAEPQALYWYDPMVPDSHFDKPGKSPFMDMQLVPKYGDVPAEAGTAQDDDGAFRIDPRVVQNLGVRLATVERQALTQRLLAAGVITVDEHRIEAVQVRAAGWVEQLAVRAVGDPVRRGQLLASVYSPELLAAQDEFLLAQRSGDASLKDASRARLALFGLGDAQIRRIAARGQAERRVDYLASNDGYVMELGARQGAMLSPGMTLFQIASLDTVWLAAELPEAQGAAIKPGDAASATVAAVPGEAFAGKVEYVYPELSGATRTVKLRITLQNPGAQLRPGMYATVQLEAAARAVALTVPTEAVIRTGTRSVVLIAEDEARFRPVAVRTGVEVGERIEVLDGLSAGQQVVASGQFLIDSEASLRGALDRLSAPAAEPQPMVDPHAGHVMPAEPVKDPHAGHEGHQGHQP
ncbi:efflux RND transporter periplasmic adaptor subunit [Nevskia sp.]|uniref:efflux RND transporter periplasmic adaptor subunit n=1 Tax=Nevskia sp. TaxID=1929292 RepID=UPI0025D0E0A3|nr:efflux RND transporter periplasmic adaptor subunit [Nevskia sp.]